MTTQKGNGPRVSSGPGSKQDYATPLDFIAAVERRFGSITFDLAAHSENTKAANWYGPGGEQLDSFAADWQLPGLLWLNPPFSGIAPWAAKCAREAAVVATIAMLVPASVGSNWFRDHVAPHADVYLLNGRISFDGKNLFPKDCLLAHYHGARPTMRIWSWRADEVLEPWDAPKRGRRAA